MTDDSSPDPGGRETDAEARRLKAWSGYSYRQLEKRAAAVGESLPSGTLATALGRGTLPNERLVGALARACGCDGPSVAAWRRLAMNEACPVPDPVTRPERGPRRPGHLAALLGVAAVLAATSSGPRRATPVLIRSVLRRSSMGDPP